jgi:hypothetical protein
VPELAQRNSATSVGCYFWLTEVNRTSVGSQNLTNFHKLPSKPTEVKYPTEMSVILVVTWLKSKIWMIFFLTEEIDGLVEEFPTDKAPGPDGFNDVFTKIILVDYKK